MNKNEFITCLREKLANYPTSEVDKAINFYTESIEDRIEDGMSEEEAITSLGSLDEIVKQIQSEMPINTIVKNKFEKQKSKANSSNIILWILLAILTFPIWFPAMMVVIGLIFAFFATVIGLCIGAIATIFGLCIAGIATFGYCSVNAISLTPGIIVLLVGLTLMGIGLIIPAGRFTMWLFRVVIDGIKTLYRSIKKALV